MPLCTAAASLAAAVMAGTAVAAEPAAGLVEVVESSEAGAHWKAMPPLRWELEFAAEVAVTARLEQRKQRVMGFGSAMTDTSAYNAMVWMDNGTRSGCTYRPVAHICYSRRNGGSFSCRSKTVQTDLEVEALSKRWRNSPRSKRGTTHLTTRSSIKQNIAIVMR